MSTNKETVFRKHGKNEFFLASSVFQTPEVLLDIIEDVLCFKSSVRFRLTNTTLKDIDSLLKGKTQEEKTQEGKIRKEKTRDFLYGLLKEEKIRAINDNDLTNERCEDMLLLTCRQEDLADKPFMRRFVLEKPKYSAYYDLKEFGDTYVHGRILLGKKKIRHYISLGKKDIQNIQHLSIEVNDQAYQFPIDSDARAGQHFKFSIPKAKAGKEYIFSFAANQLEPPISVNLAGVDSDSVLELVYEGEAYQLRSYVAQSPKKTRKNTFKVYEDRAGIPKDTANTESLPEDLDTYIKQDLDTGIRLESDLKKEYILEGELSSGGEGAVFHVEEEPNLVAKLYTKEIDRTLEEKLRKMISLRELSQHPYIAYPQQMLYYQGHFVGYLMRKVSGVPLHILNYKVLKSQHRNWSRKDLVWIAANYLRLVRDIHDRGILLVDINEGNILLDSERRTLSLVDLDSAQVEAYPCHVGVEDFFSAKKLQNHRSKEREHWLSSWEDERFSISIFVFMMLMGGRHPYDYKGRDEDGSKKNIEANFVYPYQGQGDSSQIPGKAFSPLWEYLTDEMQCLFHRIFRLKESLSTKELLEALEAYERFLEKNPDKGKLFF